MDKPIPEAVVEAAMRAYEAEVDGAVHSPAVPREAMRAALTAAQQQGQAVAWQAEVQRAIERARVFDDGSDGADAESAQSVVGILSGLLNEPPMQQGGGEVIQRHVVTKYRDGSVHVADVAAPPSAPVGGMTKDSRVPDDYRNQASGYRAGWNDALASDLAQQPAAVDGALPLSRDHVESIMQLLYSASNGSQNIFANTADELRDLLATQRQEPKS